MSIKFAKNTAVLCEVPYDEFATRRGTSPRVQDEDLDWRICCARSDPCDDVRCDDGQRCHIDDVRQPVCHVAGDDVTG